jgi:hypothetical protein
MLPRRENGQCKKQKGWSKRLLQPFHADVRTTDTRSSGTMLSRSTASTPDAVL